jgi:hypothetical protein
MPGDVELVSTPFLNLAKCITLCIVQPIITVTVQILLILFLFRLKKYINTILSYNDCAFILVLGMVAHAACTHNYFLKEI